MQIVIDIDENYYKAIKEIPVEQSTTDMLIIRNGTPLPKGHGRLIDVNDLYEQYAYTGYNFDMTMEYVPTIIEADRGIEK